MRKYIPFICICFIACNSGPSSKKEQTVPAETKEKTALPADFSHSFEKVLGNYYILRDGFVAEDSEAVNKAAAELASAATALTLDELKPLDPENLIIPTARTYISGIESELKGLSGEKDMESQRKAFQMVTANLYDLARTVRYGDEKIYLLHCPMAFNDTGADWLSSTTEIKNPYFGSRMLKCGFVKDSVSVQ